MKEYILSVVVVISVLFGVFYVGVIVSDLRNIATLGATPGTDHFQAETFSNTLTGYCIKIQQLGATKTASTTYYLVASTSASAVTIGGGFLVFATSTKPTVCP